MKLAYNSPWNHHPLNTLYIGHGVSQKFINLGLIPNGVCNLLLSFVKISFFFNMLWRSTCSIHFWKKDVFIKLNKRLQTTFYGGQTTEHEDRVFENIWFTYPRYTQRLTSAYLRISTFFEITIQFPLKSPPTEFFVYPESIIHDFSPKVQ